MASPSKLVSPLEELPPPPECDLSQLPQDSPIIEALATKLAQSVSLVKSLTLKHHKAVAQNSELHAALQTTKIENDDLKIENTDLRDRVSLLESITVFEEPKSPRNQAEKPKLETNGSNTLRSDWGRTKSILAWSSSLLIFNFLHVP